MLSTGGIQLVKTNKFSVPRAGDAKGYELSPFY